MFKYKYKLINNKYKFGIYSIIQLNFIYKMNNIDFYKKLKFLNKKINVLFNNIE